MPVKLKSLPGPHDILRVELPNGITVLSRPNFSSPSVTITGYLPCGSMFDPPGKRGLAYLTSLALNRGTATHTFEEIFSLLENSAASLGFAASVHNTSFHGRCLVEDLPMLFNLLSGCLRTPVFPVEPVERLRAQMISGLTIRQQDTGERASMMFDEVVFPGHPYGEPEDGYVETISAVQTPDLAEFHRTHYGPHGMVVVVVGGVDPNQAVEAVQGAFGDWQDHDQRPPAELPDLHPLKETVRQHVVIPGKSQTDLVIGTLGPHRRSEDYLVASLGNNVLGQFGMMGRIGDVVREREGLAYSASTSLNAWIGGGSWEVSAGVNPANLQRAIDLILSELRRFTREPVTRDELADSQAYFTGRQPLMLESNGGVAGALLSMERFQLGLDYHQRYAGLVMAITPEKVLEVAQRYINPERLAIISAGAEL